MKPFIFLLWCHLLNFPVNVPFITFPLLMPLLITFLNCKPGLPTRFLFFLILLFDHCCKMVTTPKGWDVLLCSKVCKVLIFFIVKLNNNSISSTKSAQFGSITLIKMLIKNVNSQHPLNYYQGSTIGVHRVWTYPSFYWHMHDFGHAHIDTYAHFFHMIF